MQYMLSEEEYGDYKENIEKANGFDSITEKAQRYVEENGCNAKKGYCGECPVLKLSPLLYYNQYRCLADEFTELPK